MGYDSTFKPTEVDAESANYGGPANFNINYVPTYSPVLGGPYQFNPTSIDVVFALETEFFLQITTNNDYNEVDYKGVRISAPQVNYKASSMSRL